MTSTQLHNQCIKNLIVFYEVNKRSPHSRKETQLFNYVCNIKRKKVNIHKHVDVHTAKKVMSLITKYDNSTRARISRKTDALISFFEKNECRPHHKYDKELYNFMVKVMGNQCDLYKYVNKITADTVFWYLDKYQSYKNKPFGKKEILQVLNYLKKMGKVPSNTGRVYQVYKKLLRQEIDPAKFLNTYELETLLTYLKGKELESRQEYSQEDFEELYQIIRESKIPHWKNNRRLNYLMYEIKARDSGFSHKNCSKELLDKILIILRNSKTFRLKRYSSVDFTELIQYLIDNGRPGIKEKRMYTLLLQIENRKVQPDDFITTNQLHILKGLIKKHPSKKKIAKRKKKHQQKPLKQLII